MKLAAPLLLLALAGPAWAAPAASPAAAQDIREIRGPVPLPQPIPGWCYAAGIAGALGVAAGVQLWRSRKRRPLPPHVRALEALAAQRRNPPTSAREFSVSVSETIRAYVEEAFPVRAVHRTTDELLADLMADTSPVAAQRGSLGVFLHHCDLAKFARWSLAAEDREAMLESAEAFVRATASTERAPVMHSATAGAGSVA